MKSRVSAIVVTARARCSWSFTALPQTEVALLSPTKMGITAQVKPRIKWVSGGGVVQDAVAKGESEIALGPYLSDMRNPGLDIVGALPTGASTPIDITGFLSTGAKDSKPAKALLAYL